MFHMPGLSSVKSGLNIEISDIEKFWCWPTWRLGLSVRLCSSLHPIPPCPEPTCTGSHPEFSSHRWDPGRSKIHDDYGLRWSLTHVYKLHVDLRDGGIGNSTEAEDLPEEDPEGPDVALVVDHPGLQDLRSHPAYWEAGAVAGEILHWGVKRPGETKVRHLGHSLVFLEENISGGQVTVDNLILLQKLHTPANLRRNMRILPSLHLVITW